MSITLPPSHDQLEEIRVLHVDDEPSFADMAATFIEREDDRYAVETATSASEGLNRLNEKQFDCVVSDFDMPSQNGIEFLEAVRDTHSDLPFILFTGKGSEEIASEAISAGVTEYLQKGTDTSRYTILANRITNVVEQFRSRLAIEETEQKLSQIAEHTDNILFMFNGDWSELLFINSAYEDICGGPVDELRADPKSFLEYIHPDDREHAIESMEQIFSGESIDIEYRVIRPDGEQRWINGKTKPIFDADGAISRIVGYARDITDRKEREQELKRKERRYQAVFNDPNILVGSIDTDGTVRDINQTALEYIDATPDEVIGEPFWETPWFDHSETVVEQVKDWIERAAAGEYVEFEVDLVRPDGELYTVEGVFRPVTNEDGEVVSLLISDRDITGRKEYQQQLKNEQQFVQSIFQSLPDPFYTFDTDGYPIRWNEEFEAVTGYSSSEIEEMHVTEFVPEDETDIISKNFQSILDNTQQVTVESAFETKQGTRIPHEFTGGPLESVDGTLHGVTGISWDISERKEREQQLRLFRKAVESAGHSIYFTNKNGVIEYVNLAFEEMTEYSADQAIGMTPRILKSGEHDTRFYEELWDTVLSGETWRSEIINRTKTGDQYVVDQTIAPVENEDGEIAHFVAINVDITERKNREQQLQRFKQSVEHAGHAVFITDVNGTIEYANPAFEETTEYDAEEAIGRTPQILKSGEMSEEYYEQLWSTILNGDVWREPIVNRRKSGERYHAKQTIAPVMNNGTVTAFVSIQADVTETKERERKLQRQNERLEDFASIVSHDLRNPLSVAQGRLELAAKEYDSNHLDHVARAHDRMEALIDDLLTLARQGDTIADVEPVDLAMIAKRCWGNVDSGDATLTSEIDRTVRADENRLKHVFENLLRNAVEHNDENVTITVGELDDGFYVEDDGPGIPVDERDNIFNAGYSTNQDGTGFGLNIVKQVIEAHDWEIRVTDGSEGGARFEITNIEFTGE